MVWLIYAKLYLTTRPDSSTQTSRRRTPFPFFKDNGHESSAIFISGMIHHITADKIFHHHSNVIQINIYSPTMTAHKKQRGP